MSRSKLPRNFFLGVEGQDAIDLLNRPNEKDAALYRGLNKRIVGMIEKFLRGTARI